MLNQHVLHYNLNPAAGDPVNSAILSNIVLTKLFTRKQNIYFLKIYNNN